MTKAERAELLRAASHGAAATVEAFLARGVHPDSVTDKRGETLLHWAARVNDQAMIQLLLAHGASPAMQDMWGNTPMQQLYSAGLRKAETAARTPAESTALTCAEQAAEAAAAAQEASAEAVAAAEEAAALLRRKLDAAINEKATIAAELRASRSNEDRYRRERDEARRQVCIRGGGPASRPPPPPPPSSGFKRQRPF